LLIRGRHSVLDWSFSVNERMRKPRERYIPVMSNTRVRVINLGMWT